VISKVQNPELFTKYIEPIYVFYLKDRASAIREEAISHLGQFAKVYGPTWVNAFISKLSEVLTKDGGFHFKIAAIYSLKELILSVHGEMIV
jgi:serine/threonine-protein phosphatase 2A regulatory subunit A